MGTKRLRTLDTMLKDINTYVGDVVGIKVKNILYFIFYIFSNYQLLENMIELFLANLEKVHFFYKVMKATKKDIINVVNIYILVDENQISYSKISESEKDFMDNLYDLGLSMYDN